MRPSRVRFLVRQALIAAIASSALIWAVRLWPEPASVEVRGVDGAAHRVAGREAIFHCILEEDDEGLRRMLAQGLDLNTPVFEAGGWTILHHAAYQGTREAVEMLIQRGADVNARVKDGPTPLQVARTAGREEIVEILRKHGAK